METEGESIISFRGKDLHQKEQRARVTSIFLWDLWSIRHHIDDCIWRLSWKLWQCYWDKQRWSKRTPQNHAHWKNCCQPALRRHIIANGRWLLSNARKTIAEGHRSRMQCNCSGKRLQLSSLVCIEKRKELQKERHLLMRPRSTSRSPRNFMVLKSLNQVLKDAIRFSGYYGRIIQRSETIFNQH